ncbi:phage tail tape measure protein [Paraclostridium bifermentans]|uniref:phage tail tape measure protein n=1 Tax=Paraclostridium bifermentans TaxID=1490 RepID=UPI001D00F29F|nr:phage tail tape measure protein [Paraclostridium bifermentans]
MSMDLGTAIAYIDIDASKFQRGMINVANGLRTFNDKTLDTSTRFKALGDTMQSTGRKMTLGVTLPLAGMAGAAAKSAIDFESAFAGVRKTVDASESDMKKLESGIRDMAKEMPTAATEIAGVAEAAGQLGIKTPNILDFTKIMVMLGDSTIMSAEEAATSLARLANITGMSQGDFDRLGSTIVALGNNMAANESEITNMGLRLAGAGNQVGMTEAQIMSFAAALSSVGIEAEAGGSAFSKVMVEMQLAAEKGGSKLNNFAKVAGMSASDFKKAYETDAAGAIMKFIEGLGSAEERGISAIGILDGMGISEVRLRDSLLRAADASGVFSEALGIGTQAWKENNALTNEYNQRAETTASKLLILKNNLIEVGIQIGGILIPYIQDFVSWLQGLIEKFQGLEPSTQDFIVKAGLMAAVIGPLLMLFGSLISTVTTIGGALTGLAGMFGLAGGAAAGTSGALGGLLGAGGLLSSFLTGGLIFALFGLVAKLGESREALGWLQDKFGSLGTVIGGVCEFIAGIWNLTIDNMINVGKLGFDVLAAMIDGPGGATVKDAFTKYNKGVEEINKNAWDNITMKTTRELSQQKNSVDTETKQASDKAKTNTDKMAKDMTDNAKKGADGVGKEMKNTSKVVMDESGKIPKDVQSNMQKSVQSMKQAGSDIFNGMNTSFSKTASQGKQHFSDLFNGTTKSSGKMKDKVIADWKSIRDALSKSITGTVEIKVSGYQSALNKIQAVKDAASTVRFEGVSQPASPVMNLMAMPQNFAMPIDTNMYAQAYDMLKSNDIASFVSSKIPSSINLNIEDNKSKSNQKRDKDVIKEGDIIIQIEKVENNREQDVRKIAADLASLIKREMYGRGRL